MLSELRSIRNNVSRSINAVNELNKRKDSLVSDIKELNKRYTEEDITTEDYKKKLKNVLKGKPEQKQIVEIDTQIKKYLEVIQKEVSKIPGLFSIKEAEVSQISLVKREDVKRFVSSIGRKEKNIIKVEKFTTYEPNEIGKISNKIFQEYTKRMVKKYPEFFNELNIKLKTANVKIFSSTYLSIAMSSALLSFFLGFLFMILIIMPISIFAYIGLFFASFLFPVAVILGFYFYPQTVISSRSRAMKNEIPFALIHMSSVAGSGARLIDIFTMLLESKEYPSLSGEIKRIINYVNLFGYNMTTAIKAVSKDTPSDELRDTLNGMASTIETGGDIKEYLKSKAEDALTDYKLRRRRYISTVETYSEIYTAVLIVAPLLLIVILTIIAGIGEAEIAGISIDLMQKIGTFMVLPLLNIFFIIFIKMVQPEM